MRHFDVVGFGALNTDKLFKVNYIAAAEEESFITGFSETCGGSAANTAVGLARLGVKTGFIGKTADDREGHMLVTDFVNEGVDIEGIIHSKKGKSGTVMGFVDKRGERALYIAPGVNDSLAFRELNKEYARDSKYVHLTSFVGTKSFETQVKFVEALRDDVRVSLDPGSIYAGKGFDGLKQVIRKTYLLMPNALELELLSGKSDYCAGAEFMLEKGVKIIAVKLGAKGCYVADGVETHIVPSFKVRAVDTTGAGDAFCAGFLYGGLHKKSLEECGRIANFVASRCVMKMGARAGLPYREDLELLS